jgi:hypothetical protein
MPVDEEVIRGWKREYGKVFSVEARGIEYVFRPLTFREFDDVRLDPESSADAEENIVAHALLHPEKLDDQVPAGVVTAIAMQVVEISGFGNPKMMNAILEEKRGNAGGDVRTMMKAFVIATMPSYTDEQLDDMTFEALAKKVALAELVMKVQQGAVGVEHELKVHILDPEEEALKAQEEQQKHAVSKKPGTAGFNDPIAQKLYEALNTQ